MIPLILLACLLPPLFVDDGPECPEALQPIQCECSECMWLAPSPGAVRYEIRREEIGVAGPYDVGEIVEVVWFDEDAGETRRELPRVWCFAWDSSFPREGVLYRYFVRSCDLRKCGQWTVTAGATL